MKLTMLVTKKLSKKQWISVGVSIPLLLGGWLVLRHKPAADAGPVVSAENTGKKIRGQYHEPALADSGAASAKLGEASKEGSRANAMNPVPGTSNLPEISFETLSHDDRKQVREELNAYLDLNETQLKTASEKEKLKNLYTDPELMKTVAHVLMTPPATVDDEARKLHQDATEFLISAAKVDGELASEAVLNVLASPLLENPAVSREVRQLLAESQAELMYELVPTQKAVADFVRNQASKTQQQIYKNIHATYQLNMADSQAELAKHK